MSFLLGDADPFKRSGLSEYVMSRVFDWRTARDNEYAERWEEYWQLWLGQKDLLRRGDNKTKSRAVMPAIAQAVEASVAELEEVIFANQRWFDVENDTPDPTVRLIADNLLHDLSPMRAAICEMFLIGAVFGTGIGKMSLQEGLSGKIALTLVPILPFEFGIDPVATNIAEAHGVFHEMLIPRAVMLARQRAGVWAEVDPGSHTEGEFPRHLMDERTSTVNTDVIHIVEYHGLVERDMLPEEEQPVRDEKLNFEEDALVEAIVTVANGSTVLKAVANPFTHKDRSFIAYQHDTIPRRFWGRGVPQKGYWPQKVLDTEIRARNDALALSTRPMMGISTTAMNIRSRNLEVRAGRNVFVNTGATGRVTDVITPLQFPGPDPQTYQQAANMERMVDVATGGFQTPHSAATSGRESATGISQLNASAVRRTKRTVRNIEFNALMPLIRQSLWRFQQFNSEQYPQMPIPFKVNAGMTMIAREREQQVLTTIMTNLSDGPAQLLVLRTILENSALVDRERVIGVTDMMLQQAVTQQEQQQQPDLSGQARIMNAELQRMQALHNAQMDVANMQFKEAELDLQRERLIKDNQRGLIALNNDAERIEAEAEKDRTDAVKKLAEAAEITIRNELAPIREQVASLESLAKTAKTAAEAEEKLTQEVVTPITRPSRRTPSSTSEPTRANGLSSAEPLPQAENEPPEEKVLRIKRDDRGLIETVNDTPVVRDSNNLITELPI